MSLYDDPDTSLTASTNGLGSLADELGDLLGGSGDEGEYDEDEMDALYGGGGEGSYDDDYNDDSGSEPEDGVLSETNGVASPQSVRSGRRKSLGAGFGRVKDEEEEADGERITPGLETQLREIEEAALRSKGEMMESGEEGDVVRKLQEGLQTLKPQAGMENGVQRLTTAQSAVSTHLFTSTAILRDLSFSLTPHSLPPEDTEHLLDSLLTHIPRPSLLPLSELSALHILTSELMSQLSVLGDSLHMARQNSITASRRLRVAKEAAEEWRNEVEMVEKARRWIEEGEWGRRLGEREAGREVEEVLRGFGEACGRVEEKLKGGLGVGVEV